MIATLTNQKYHSSRKPVNAHSIASGAYSMVYPTTNSKTLRYYTNYIERIEFLQVLGVTWDTPVKIGKNADYGYSQVSYSVTVTRLLPYDDMTSEQINAISEEREAFYALSRVFERNYS